MSARYFTSCERDGWTHTRAVEIRDNGAGFYISHDGSKLPMTKSNRVTLESALMNVKHNVWIEVTDQYVTSPAVRIETEAPCDEGAW